MKQPTPQPPLVRRASPPAGQIEVGVFIPPEEVFPGLEGTEKALIGLLATLSRDDTLIHAARLNTLISGPGDFDARGRQQTALNWICTKEQIERINDFIRRHKTSGPITIFFRGQILELVRWAARYCVNLPGDGGTFHDAQRRENLLKAVLVAGVLWGQRTYRDKLSGGGDIADIRLRALGALRKGVEETNLAPHLGIALARGRALFADHFPRRCPDFAARFQRATGLTIAHYRGCVAALSIYTLFNWKDGPMFPTQTVAATTANRDIFPAFFALEGQSPEQLAASLWDDFDTRGYRGLRERPIMITTDGRGIILDPTFYGEKISIGPLFHLLKGASRSEANEIFGAFGLAFEDYATDILKRMYPSRPGLVDRLSCGMRGVDGQGRQFEIDASLFDVSQAAVFEMKAAWLREDAIVDDTHEHLLRDIRAKYGALPATSGERGKGVAQLARSIGAIVRGEWFGPKREFAGTTVIYPVLVVHDTRLDAPALGSFLDTEFKTLLGPVPGGKRVAPLTIMTIQDLENLESSVAHFSFIELLAVYSRECPDRLRSLHNFIAYSSFAKNIFPSSYLMQSSAEILELLQKELFPGASLPPPVPKSS